MPNDLMGGLNSLQGLNPATATPTAMQNYVGSPLANGGANLLNYQERMAPFAGMPAPGGIVGGISSGIPQASAPQALPSGPFRLNQKNQNLAQIGQLAPQMQFASPPPADTTAITQMNLAAMPQPPQKGTSSPATYRTGGLAQAQDGMGGMGGMIGDDDDDGEADPRLVAAITEIFERNMDDPQKIANEILQLLTEEIKNSVSPEDMEYLHSEEGQEQIAQAVEELMAKFQGAGGGGQAPQGGLAQAQAPSSMGG